MAFVLARELPHNIQEPIPGQLRVRVQSHKKDISRTFREDQHGGCRETTIKAAIAWRDETLKSLPPSYNKPGAFKKPATPYPPDDFRRPGITRYVAVKGGSRYIRYGASWVDSSGRPRVTGFMAGRIIELGTFEETIPKEQDLHARRTALAFREHWEHCREHGVPFDPTPYRAWKTETLYPFNPTSPPQRSQRAPRSLARVLNPVPRYFIQQGRQYLRYVVDWYDDDGKKRTKSFQAGNTACLDDASIDNALASAQAFHDFWTDCRSRGVPFNPRNFEAWRASRSD